MNSVQPYTGHHPRNHSSIEPSVSRKGSGNDFASLIDDPPRAGKHRGLTSDGSGGVRGSGSADAIEPFTMTADQLALLAADNLTEDQEPTEPAAVPPPHADPLEAATEPGTEPAVAAGRGSGSSASMGTEPVALDPDTPNSTSVASTEPQAVDQSVLNVDSDSETEEKAIAAMREVMTRFTSMNALLQLTQGI